MPGRRFNILLLGSDDDRKFAPGAVLTQSMILVSIDPNTHDVAMVSIPRDFWVPIAGYGTQKIDVAYEVGGVALARRTVERLFGLRVDYYAWVGLQGLVQVVDGLGGIELRVLHPVLDETYPDDLNADDPYAYFRLYIPSGPQHMDGATALEYVRSRHGDLQSDFGRSARQQQLLLAIKNEAEDPSVLPRLPQIVSSLADSVRTDLGAPAIAQLAVLSRDVSPEHIHRQVLSAPQFASLGVSPDGSQQIVLPDWQAIRPEMARLLHLHAAETGSAALAPSPASSAAYECFLAALAAALTKRSAAARFDGDTDDLSETLICQTLAESDAYVMHEDCELEWSRIVQAVWRERDAQTTALVQHRQETLPRPAGGRGVAWTIEPASPLARRAPPGSANGDLMVYVASHAALPPDRTRQRPEPGSKLSSMGVQTVASERYANCARAASWVPLRPHVGLRGAYLARPLPARLHSAVERFRLESAHRLRDIDLIGAENQVVASMTDVLLASLREPVVAADLEAALEALLEHLHLPRILVLGRQRQWLLPIPRVHSQWIELVREHLKAGFEEDLGALWADDPQCPYAPEYGEESLIDTLRAVQARVDADAV